MKILLALFLSLTLLIGVGCAQAQETATLTVSNKEYIEQFLNLRYNAEQEWTYAAAADAWTLSIVQAVAYPELPDQQGVSVCVPGAFVMGIDTDRDGVADVEASEVSSGIKGNLVIDYDAQIESTNGQTYTAATAPLIMTTGAAGYGSQNNSKASSNYAKDGYIAIACGNRGKQDTATDLEGNTYYTGDAPSCLADQKAAARYVKYNILLGNLPGCADYLVVTGGSGGGAHAAMFAATSNHPDFYDYQIEAGAVGVYLNADGSFDTSVNIDGEAVLLSDGAWGCVAYSAITSLYEADAAQAFEYYMDTTYAFNTPFQQQLAAYLSEAYMNYINAQNLTIDEAKVCFDLNGDGDMEDVVALTIEYDPQAHPETNGYYGSYLELYRAEFRENLQWYLDNLDYAEGWTWFDAEGNVVFNLTSVEKAQAFLEGRYAKDNAGGRDGMMRGMEMMGGMPGGMPGGDAPDGMGDDAQAMFGEGIRDGGPMMGGTASAGSDSDSSTYDSFEAMAADYASDIAEIDAGDKYGNNIVSLYNPLNYIGEEGTDNPAWTRVVMGAIEGDISMMSSLNLEIAWLCAGVDVVIEWQWDGGHVPSEALGNTLSLYIDMMYAEHVSGVKTVKPRATQTTEGTASAATGNSLMEWVNAKDVSAVDFTLADILAYRNSRASKAVPGFDVIDHGQENYVFGSKTKDARHWDMFLNDIFQNETFAEVLRTLFNAE